MLPKSNGGMTMSNLVAMNKTCLMKLAWALNSGLWSQVLQGKYGRGMLWIRISWPCRR